MGIYIRDMEMPRDIEPGLCIEFADGIDGKRYARLYHYRHGGLTEWLEALSVSSRGALIDRAELWVEISKICDRRDAGIITDLTCLQQILSAVRHTPTIIPAELSSENEIHIIDTKGKPNYDLKHRFVISAPTIIPAEEK